jgi:hypothetical protein
MAEEAAAAAAIDERTMAFTIRSKASRASSQVTTVSGSGKSVLEKIQKKKSAKSKSFIEIYLI